jgi:lysyl-tRNA synthetase class 2
MTEEELDVYSLIKGLESVALEDTKSKSGLSNKKWDKVIKSLTAKAIIKVERLEDVMVMKDNLS